MTVRDAEPMDVYVDANNRLWRVVGIWREPVVHMQAIEGADEPLAPGLTRAEITAGVSGLLWNGFTRIHRPKATAGVEMGTLKPLPDAPRVFSGFGESRGTSAMRDIRALQEVQKIEASNGPAPFKFPDPILVETAPHGIKLRFEVGLPLALVVQFANERYFLQNKVWRWRGGENHPHVFRHEGCDWRQVWLDAVEPTEGAAT